VTERERHTTITRLGQGVDRKGALAPRPWSASSPPLARYRAIVDDAGGADRTIGVLTSAVRDASKRRGFAAAVRDRYGVDAHTIAARRSRA
jgi:exopolyphosphatase/guanosine-5'-triphosphate,3'-diphosphate pyrophosphatase